MAGLTLLAPDALDIPLPTAPLLAIIGITALFNGIVLWRLTAGDIGNARRTVQPVAGRHRHAERAGVFQRRRHQPAGLAAPAAGGHCRADPAGRCVLAVGLAAVAAYSALMVFY